MENNKKVWTCGYNCSRLCGWFLLVVGGFYLLKGVGILSRDLSIWPFILIGIGLYLLKKYSR